MVAIVFITTWGVRSASVYSSWIAIELNLLFLLPIITHHNYFYGKFSAVKYFIIQRISGLIILTVVTLHVTSRGSSGWLFTLLALFFLKLGAAPFYQWVLSIGEHQSWWTIFILLTIQKLVPFYLINRFGRQGIFYLRAASILVLPVMIISLKGLKKIVIISSTYIIIGILVAIILKTHKWKSLMALYILSLVPLLRLSGLSSGSSQLPKLHEDPSDQVVWVFLLLRILGMPPLPGFIIKIEIAARMINAGFLRLMVVFQLISVILIYIYLKIILRKLFSSRIYLLPSRLSGPIVRSFFIISLAGLIF